MQNGHHANGDTTMDTMPAGTRVICRKSWTFCPEAREGAEATVVEEYYYNGEFHMTLRDDEGNEFDCPSIFWNKAV